MNKRIIRKHTKIISKLFAWRLFTANPKKSEVVNAFKKWFSDTYHKTISPKYENNIWLNYKHIRDYVLANPKHINHITYMFIVFLGVIATHLDLHITVQTFRSLYQAGAHNL